MQADPDEVTQVREAQKRGELRGARRGRRWREVRVTRGRRIGKNAQDTERNSGGINRKNAAKTT